MESFMYNHPILKERRKELRKNETPAEKILWEKLRKKRLGFKFTRQYGVGPYILDFFCREKRLAIELDGKHHGKGEQKEYDEERTRYLQDLNICVLRFWNKEVFEDTESVCKKIQQQLERKGIPFWENDKRTE
jgi:very-short-patch-repair endonuclease